MRTEPLDTSNIKPQTAPKKRRADREKTEPHKPQAHRDLLHLEFSKQIVKRIEIVLLLHITLSLLIIYFKSESASYAVSLMTATVPLYAVIFGGYFGKAGLENYQKIKSSLKLDEVILNAECGDSLENSRGGYNDYDDLGNDDPGEG